MVGRLPRKAIDFKPLSAKALDPMLVTEDGIVTDVNAFARKAFAPMLRSEDPSVTKVNALFSKALLPMLVTEDGIVTDVNALFRKALTPMPVTVTPLPLSDGIVRDMPLHDVAQPVTVAPSPEKLNPPV